MHQLAGQGSQESTHVVDRRPRRALAFVVGRAAHQDLEADVARPVNIVALREDDTVRSEPDVRVGDAPQELDQIRIGERHAEDGIDATDPDHDPQAAGRGDPVHRDRRMLRTPRVRRDAARCIGGP
ncbi:hypothetical protein ACIQF5_31085 [Streptomyces goshikiensis]|uniref:hypothetical protein n=1 Tax=Streptomyces goshikiensis TaxID=1942 RepID=UPI00381D296C